MTLTTEEYNKLYRSLWDIFHACEGGYTCAASTALSGVLDSIADSIHDPIPVQDTDNIPVYDWDC
jgi:hypothetical protein